MAALVDTNILVYRFDPRDPAKQARARQLLRDGLESGTVYIPHQALMEFVAAVTRATPFGTLLPAPEAWHELENYLTGFPILTPPWTSSARRFVARRSIACPGSTRTCGRTRTPTASTRSSPKTFSTAGSTDRARDEPLPGQALIGYRSGRSRNHRLSRHGSPRRGGHSSRAVVCVMAFMTVS